MLPTKTQHFVEPLAVTPNTQGLDGNAEIRIEILDCMRRDPGNILVAEGSSTCGQFLE
jgi:hypothetical protein